MIFCTLVVLVVLLVLFLLLEIALKSPCGRVLRAIREDETTAAASGNNVFQFKLQAFVLGAAIMGIGGGLYTYAVRFIDPFTFDPLLATFVIWVMLMVGGTSNDLGAILGAFLVWGIWSGTQTLPGFLGDPDLRFFLVGALMVLVLLFRPNRVLGKARRVSPGATQKPRAGAAEYGIRFGQSRMVATPCLGHDSQAWMGNTPDLFGSFGFALDGPNTTA
jgi:branched-chain amino acid transport system permease protein